MVSIRDKRGIVNHRNEKIFLFFAKRRSGA